MSFQKGNMSVNFCVTKPLSKDEAVIFKNCATLALRRYSFRPVDESRGECQSYGWCDIRKPLELKFSFEDVFIDPYIYLGFRIDKKHLCPLLFKATVNEKVKKESEKQKLSKISRQQRLAIQEETMTEMLKSITAQTSFHEIVWNIETGQIYIGTAPGVNFDAIVETLMQTFDIRCFRVTPENMFRERIKTLDPAEFFSENILTHYYKNPFPENNKSMKIVFGEDITFVNIEKGKAAFKGINETGLEEKLIENFYMIHKCYLRLCCHEDEWRFNLNAEKFHISALRTPAPPLQDEEQNFKYRMEAVSQLFELLNMIIEHYFMIHKIQPQETQTA